MSKTICPVPGCNVLTKKGRCKKHQREKQKVNAQHRGTAHERGYDRKWRKAAREYLRRYPLCVVDKDDTGAVPPHLADTVDHRIPHRGDPELFWDESNWQSMCKHHHDQKTARGQ